MYYIWPGRSIFSKFARAWNEGVTAHESLNGRVRFSHCSEFRHRHPPYRSSLVPSQALSKRLCRLKRLIVDRCKHLAQLDHPHLDSRLEFSSGGVAGARVGVWTATANATSMEDRFNKGQTTGRVSAATLDRQQAIVTVYKRKRKYPQALHMARPKALPSKDQVRHIMAMHRINLNSPLSYKATQCSSPATSSQTQREISNTSRSCQA